MALLATRNTRLNHAATTDTRRCHIQPPRATNENKLTSGAAREGPFIGALVTLYAACVVAKNAAWGHRAGTRSAASSYQGVATAIAKELRFAVCGARAVARGLTGRIGLAHAIIAAQRVPLLATTTHAQAWAKRPTPAAAHQCAALSLTTRTVLDAATSALAGRAARAPEQQQQARTPHPRHGVKPTRTKSTNLTSVYPATNSSRVMFQAEASNSGK